MFLSWAFVVSQQAAERRLRTLKRREEGDPFAATARREVKHGFCAAEETRSGVLSTAAGRRWGVARGNTDESKDVCQPPADGPRTQLPKAAGAPSLARSQAKSREDVAPPSTRLLS